MKKFCSQVFASLLFILLTAGQVMACNYPRAPQLPDAESANREDMLEAQTNVRAYLAAAEAYLECLTAAEQDSENPQTPEQAEINVKRYNAMVDEMHQVSDDYNIIVRMYKARQ